MLSDLTSLKICIIIYSLQFKEMMFYLTGITHVIWKVVFHFMMLIDIYSTKTVKCKVDDRTEAIKAIKADPVRNIKGI